MALPAVLRALPKNAGRVSVDWDGTVTVTKGGSKLTLTAAEASLVVRAVKEWDAGRPPGIAVLSPD